MRKVISFCSGDRVRSAEVYAPTAINPACPSEKTPDIPLTNVRLTAMIPYIPISVIILE
jgi:hypothetical protein